MKLIIDIFSILNCLIALVVTIRSIDKFKFNYLTIFIMLFNISYVLPCLIEVVFGPPHTSYYIYNLAYADIRVSILYSLFVFVFLIGFYIFINRTKLNNKFETILFSFRKIIKSSTVLRMIVYILIIATICILLLIPDKLVYLNLGKIILSDNISSAVLTYHSKYVSLACYFLLVCLFYNKLIDVKNKCYIWRIIILIIVAFLNAKRTLLSFSIIGLLFIDLYDNTKKNKLYLIFSRVFIICVYFVLYSYLTGKYFYNTDWYAVINEYFFRSSCTKVAIYSIFDKLGSIISYSGETFVYNLFYWIPRELWSSKPYPFPQLYTSYVFGFKTNTFIGWYFQTSLFPELICNFGFLGTFIAMLILFSCFKIINKSKNVLCVLSGMFFVFFIIMFEYSDLMKIVFFVFALSYFYEKINIKKKTMKKYYYLTKYY